MVSVVTASWCRDRQHRRISRRGRGGHGDQAVEESRRARVDAAAPRVVVRSVQPPHQCTSAGVLGYGDT